MGATPHEVQEWLSRVADALEEWPPPADRGAAIVGSHPTSAAALIIQRIVPRDVIAAVTLALPLIDTHDFERLSSHLMPHMAQDRTPAGGYSESRKMRLLPRRMTPEIRSLKPYFAPNAAITFSWSDGSVSLSARH